jgi:hypothetical protein
MKSDITIWYSGRGITDDVWDNIFKPKDSLLKLDELEAQEFKRRESRLTENNEDISGVAV